MKNGKWSQKYDCCVECGTTEILHIARGKCKKCYEKEKNKGGPRAKAKAPSVGEKVKAGLGHLEAGRDGCEEFPRLDGAEDKPPKHPVVKVAPTPVNINPHGIEVTVKIELPADSIRRIEEQTSILVADEIMKRMKGL